jgi:hypothetical protein
MNNNCEKSNHNRLSTCAGWMKPARKNWVSKPRMISFVRFVFFFLICVAGEARARSIRLFVAKVFLVETLV